MKSGYTRPIRWLAIGCALVPSAAAQQASDSIEYRAGYFACARFRQDLQANVRIQSGNRGLRQTTGRTGVLIVAGQDSAGGIRLDSWFDSLMVWREDASGKASPGTDGVIGGRFAGLMSRRGHYSRLDSPFVPDEIAEITDLGAALDDLFPPVPGIPLAVGQRWQDSTGWVLTRLDDRSNRRRYRITANRETRQHLLLPDSTAVDVRLVEQETGILIWDPASGVVRWERSIEAEANIPAATGLPGGGHALLEQSVRLDRDDSAPDCRSAGGRP